MNHRKTLYDVKSFYDKKAVLKASYQGMRYQVQQFQETDEAEKKLRAVVWPEPFSYEKTPEEKKTVRDFAYSEEGLDEVYQWLCEIYEERRAQWEHARDNPWEGLVHR